MSFPLCSPSPETVINPNPALLLNHLTIPVRRSEVACVVVILLSNYDIIMDYYLYHLVKYILFLYYKAMTLGFKKWFSILGLLVAIIISLGIGAYFNFSIFEGAETLAPSEEPTDEEPTDEEPTDEEPTDEEPTDEEPTVEEPTVEETTYMTPADTSSDMSFTRPRRKRNYFTTDESTESFRLIENF